MCDRSIMYITSTPWTWILWSAANTSITDDRDQRTFHDWHSCNNVRRRNARCDRIASPRTSRRRKTSPSLKTSNGRYCNTFYTYRKANVCGVAGVDRYSCIVSIRTRGSYAGKCASICHYEKVHHFLTRRIYDSSTNGIKSKSRVLWIHYSSSVRGEDEYSDTDMG